MLPEIPFYTVEAVESLRLIKRGGGGMVSVGKLEDFGQIAVKQFIGSQEQSLEKYKKEIEILYKHRHPNIIQLYGILVDGVDKTIYLGYVMEYVKDGSLHDVIYNKEKSYNLREICIWIEQIARGLQFLHRNGIIHRDIKPENILVTAVQLKLADFGIARDVDRSRTAGAGTTRYMGPEVIRGKCSTSSDVYSLGITVWEIFHKKLPYNELGNVAHYILANKILAGARPSIEPNKMDKDMATLIRRDHNALPFYEFFRCWQANPSDRLTVKEIIDIFGGRLSGQQMGSNTATDVNVSELQESMEAVTLTVNLVPNTVAEEAPDLNSLERVGTISREMTPKIYMDRNVGNLQERTEEVTLTVNRNEVANVCNTLEEKVGNVSREKGRKTILIAGGCRDGKTFDAMAVLSADRSEWIELQFKLPYENFSSGAVYLNGEIYLFGGWDNSEALYKLDKNMKWIRLADMNEGRRYNTNSCLEWNGYIWVFGGWNENGEPLKIVERYDPKENKWTLMPEMKTVRSSAATALWNDKIIISGGWIAETTVIKTSECFNLEDGCWVHFPDMPTASGGHSLVSYKNKLILIGGIGKEVFNTVWELDPRRTYSEWEPLPPMKYPSYQFPGIVLDNEIYAIGGRQRANLPDLSRVEIFDGERWRDGPSLPYTWRCMSSVIIPQHFADRLCHRPSIKDIINFEPKFGPTILVMGELGRIIINDNKMTIWNRGESTWTVSRMEFPDHILPVGVVYLNDELYLISRGMAFFKLDKNMEWKQLADMNERRGDINNSCLEWNGYIWVFGGENWEKHLKSVERYDPKEDKWTRMPDMKNVRCRAAAAVCNGKIYICGGIGYGVYWKSVECFDPESGVWTELTDMPTPRCFHSLVCYRNRLVVLGGWDEKEKTTTVLELDPLEKNGQWKELSPLASPSLASVGVVLGREIFAIGYGHDKVQIFDGINWRVGPSFPLNYCLLSSAVLVPQEFADRLSSYPVDLKQ